ncbi:50S ribosomal protein L25/general stress protein Ctc [Aneurinibacillus aneurinilyticus]|uniref:50S ribosomal protein L25/general stress protein Ctc n=1 Tax=Aneurinibacillus aneurinilyticus TaxID=1391 RepID=UPI002E1B6983|nr:50S ribosomal protein L25/general stress protein Ctc [Aneurinibacillus aneurinilyticus]MED0671593.1 50S ribosomal protein L25/general stress protein Ctc [Aneurinibacillus aneurinilyticus]
MAIELQAQKRQVGPRSMLTELRSKGKIPAVLYGSDVESESIAIEESHFQQLVNQQGLNHVIKLNVDGKPLNVMIKDLQSDPLKNKVLHLDFGTINMNEKTDTSVFIVLQGEAEGVKNGGVLQHTLRELNISCLPDKIPDSITYNIEKLVVGDTITVADLTVSGDIEILDSPDTVVLTIVPPQAEPVEGMAGEEAETEAGIAETNDEENSSGDAEPNKNE